MNEQKKRKEDFLGNQEAFRSNAIDLIEMMLFWSSETPGSKMLVDEMLHSIFFLGYISKPKYPLEKIVDEEILEALREEFPQPFRLYSTQVPRRSPFSCVLDMIVLQKGQENENQIKESLRDLINTLKPNFLVSSTICISQKSNIPNAVRYYGVSMSTPGWKLRQIMIAASCCSTWHDYVAGAVMTYFPRGKKKSYFDGTIKLSEYIRCEAFRIRTGEPMHPCKLCRNLFGLHTTNDKSDDKTNAIKWPYGNCAEAESVSNLLKREEDDRLQAHLMSNMYREESRRRAKNNVWEELTSVLQRMGFENWDNCFYTAHTD